MALEEFINLPGWKKFLVVCKDASMIITDVTKGGTYEVLGMYQGFYLFINDKGRLGKYYKDRFEVLEDWSEK